VAHIGSALAPCVVPSAGLWLDAASRVGWTQMLNSPDSLDVWSPTDEAWTLVLSHVDSLGRAAFCRQRGACCGFRLREPSAQPAALYPTPDAAGLFQLLLASLASDSFSLRRASTFWLESPCLDEDETFRWVLRCPKRHPWFCAPVSFSWLWSVAAELGDHRHDLGAPLFLRSPAHPGVAFTDPEHALLGCSCCFGHAHAALVTVPCPRCLALIACVCHQTPRCAFAPHH